MPGIAPMSAGQGKGAWGKASELSLGNYPASGTTIIDQLDPEHIKTGKPILYTSADRVWQVAASEESFGLGRLLAICISVRKICDELGISRVIARPFVGDPARGVPFKRTYSRKDYAQLPFARTILNQLEDAGVPILKISKISNIFAGQGGSRISTPRATRTASRSRSSSSDYKGFNRGFHTLKHSLQAGYTGAKWDFSSRCCEFLAG
jgi:phosphopentomutase